MRNQLKRRPAVTPGRDKDERTDEMRELALLEEFTRHGSVASLAGAIAVRMGGSAEEEDLIARAGLGRD